MLATIDVRTEFRTFFAQLADTGQRKYLEAATICQHRTVKAVELMQSTGFFYHFQSRTQIKMIGITQYNLRLYILFQLRQMHAFHCSHCTYRHKDRCLNLPVVSSNQSGTCIGLAVCIL